MFDFLISPKVFAVGCEFKNLQLTVEKLYLKQPFPRSEKIDLYDDDRKLIASVTIPQTDIQTHSNITLELCP